MPEATYFISALFGLLVTVLGWNVKTLFTRINTHEKKHDQLREDMHKEIKEVGKLQGNQTEKLRGEINSLSESLRKEISNYANQTNQLLVQVLDNKR